MTSATLDITMSAAGGSPGLLSPSDLVYQGAVRVALGSGSANSTYSDAIIGLGPSGLFMVGTNTTYSIFEQTLPQFTDDILANCQRAVERQPYADIDPRVSNWRTCWTAAGRHLTAHQLQIGGLHVYGGALYATVYHYYDGPGVIAHSLLKIIDATNLAGSAVEGVFQLGVPADFSGHQPGGFTGGWICDIPSEYQPRLGGATHAVGQSSLSIISRTSAGPALAACRLADAGVVDPIPVSPLVYYPMTVPPYLETIIRGDPAQTSSVWSALSGMTGCAWIGRTVLFFGSHGYGDYYYGTGTSDISLHGQPAGDGSLYVYDPCGWTWGKGGHSYGGDYRTQVWAYDAEELIRVYDGELQPWDVLPYSVFTLDLPFAPCSKPSGSMVYDAANSRLLVAMRNSDGVPGYIVQPVIHSFGVP